MEENYYSVIKRTYVEINWGKVKTSTLVSERNPLMFYNEGNKKIMTGIRFFDIREVEFYREDDDSLVDKITGKEENYSPMYYFGERLTIEQFKDRYGSAYLKQFINELEEKNINSVIVCDCGTIISNPEEGSMTIHEYQESLKEKENQSNPWENLIQKRFLGKN